MENNIPTTTPINTNTTPPPPLTSITKTPESDSESPFRIQPIKQQQPLSFTNGLLKRHHTIHYHHHNSSPPIVLIYKECLKNHAASLGGHSLDGCGEFMLSDSATRTDPTSLRCAACGCHRNFHRREPEDLPSPTTAVIEYQPHHRHRPPPPHAAGSPSSPSPPPISSSYPASAPHMLLPLSSGGMPNGTPVGVGVGGGVHQQHHQEQQKSSSRKRHRTKFTAIQKEKMYELSERVGWKIQKRDEAAIAEFCDGIGVDRGVLKVWMHNNKTTFGKRDNNNNNIATTTTTNNNNAIANNSVVINGAPYSNNHNNNVDANHNHPNNGGDGGQFINGSGSDHVILTNGSGSSSSS